MKRKQGRRVLIALTLLFAVIVPLAGCKQENRQQASKSYYVISEELDVNKTADKAQEILENSN